MTEFTISCSQGRVAEHHDKREYYPENARDYMAENNKTIVSVSDYKKEFEDIFETYKQEYNKSGKRTKISNYYDHIAHGDGKEKPFYEYVLQVGNHEDNDVGMIGFNEDTDKAKEALDEVAGQLQELYPSFHFMFIGSHGDEPGGTYHYHVCFTPVATGYKNGMEKRCSLTKALDNMGFKKKGNQYAIDVWKQDVEAHIEKALQNRGIGRKYKNEHRRRLSVSDYKQSMMIKNIEEVEAETQALKTENKELNIKLKKKEKDLDKREQSLDNKQDNLSQIERLFAEQYQDMIAREQALAMREQSLDKREQSIEQKEKEQEEKATEFQKWEDAIEAQKQALADKENLLNERSKKINDTRKKQMEQGNFIKDTCRLAQQDRKWLDEKDKQHAEAIQQRLNIDIVDYSAEIDHSLSK